ncbi:MAG: hypothetical protein IJ588_11030 [Prevotella sp.]|nr:hypothetical protein [Prevotella sp.]
MIQNSSIEVIHSGNTIQDFAVSAVAIWNAGTTIKREDVATKDPLHISMSDDAEILEAQLLFSEKQNDITWQLSDDKKSIVIDFEYLAKKEGFVMKVFHTGTKSNSLTAGCSLTSGKNLTKSEWGLFKLARRIGHRVPYHRFRKIYGWMIVIMCLIVAAEVVLAYNKLVIPHSGGLTSAIIQTAVYLSLAYYAYRTFISPRLPKKLTRYFYGED